MPEHDPLIRRVLGANYLELGLTRLAADEAAADPISTADETAGAHAPAHASDRPADRAISVKLSINEKRAGLEAVVEVEGEGAGLVHATYAAVLSRYGREYQSLHSIQVVEYAVIADVAGSGGRSRKSVDAVGEAIGKVTIEALNSEGRRFTFGDSSRSVTASTARAVLAMVQYFLNAERAFITLDHARRDAIERGREDLVSRYTAEMAEVVESTSYAEVIESIRKRMTAPK